MHISMGFLCLCFQIIQGEITRCPMGGLYDEDLCKTLIDESVYNRFYIDSFQTEILGKENNTHDVYDKPYQSFKENTDIPAVTSTPAIKHNKIKFAISSDHEALQLANEIKNNRIIFRQSIIVNDHDPIDIQWYDALSIGTDTYRLKFHSKLISKYKNDSNPLSSKELLVLIQSYYNAASTHYFSRNYETAYKVIEEGLVFIIRSKDDVSAWSENLKVWNSLFLTLKEDIENIMNNKNTETVNKLSNLNNLLSKETLIIPCSVALFFRGYFLDDVDKNFKKNTLESWLSKNKGWEAIDNDIIHNKNISMLYFLIISNFANKVEDKVENIIKAIQRPVLCIEDRLLNYEANKLALEMLGHCFDDDTSWTSNHTTSCIQLNKLQKTNFVVWKTIIPKLSNESYVKYHKKNPMKELYDSLSTQDTIINQKSLHVIVTAAIDFIDITSEKYKEIKENIKLAIKFLNTYVNGQMSKLKKNDEKITLDINTKEISENQTETEPIYKCEIDKNKEQFVPQTNINYDTEEHFNAVFCTKYSSDDFRMKNIFIAFKWLAELNGVLCNNSESEPDILQYQNELKSSIDSANRFVSKYKNDSLIIVDEDHFVYLSLKRKAKIFTPSSHWEATWPGGWIPSTANKLNLIILDYASCKNKRSEMFMRLQFLNDNSDCPYINKIELNILLYRYVKKTFANDHKLMYHYIKKAIDAVVITSEDRVRNMEAHELFSRYLVERNRYAIEKGIQLSSYELYKKYLEPQIGEIMIKDQKTNEPIEPQLDKENP